MKKLRNALIKGLFFVIVFFISLRIAGNILNRGNTDLTADIQPASLPIVYMNINDVKMNALHGYLSHMEGSSLRGMITPINADRTLDIIVDSYGTSIAKVSFEVRSLDCKRLIESEDLSSFEFNNDIITAKLSFKDLIDDDKEYMLIIKLTTGDGYVIDYYTRIINTTELSLMDKIDFCTYFSETTFDQGKAPELKKYMESNSSGDNSSYAYVNIHSSFNQLSWGTLNPELIGEKQINLISVDALNGCIQLLYRVKIKDELYNVKEYFRVRNGKDRMYLMEYERTMNQLITNEDNVIVNNKIINGIINEDIEYIESPSDSIVAFVQQNSLYSFNTSTGHLNRIFSFRDNENDDLRTDFNGHKIKIMSIDEAGNIHFLVYGYMNRGIHEGRVGVALYYYDSVVNTIEEQLFVPYDKSYEILEQNVSVLSYINSRSNMFLLVNGAVYSINLESKETKIVASNLDENRFVSSKDNSIIAWQTGESLIEYNSIQLYSLDKLNPDTIEAAHGDIIIPLGFIGNDLVFGTSHISDITTDDTGRSIIPMYKITIKSASGNILKEYQKDNVFVSEVIINDTLINLTRLAKEEETGRFIEIDPDQILASDFGSLMSNVYKSVITEEMETTYQIVLCKEGNYDKVKILNPKEVLYEGNRDIILEGKDNVNRYYVYAKGSLLRSYTSPSDAVSLAEESFGVVVNKSMGYIWESGGRRNSAKIETIGDRALSIEEAESGITPAAVCLEEMLKYKEVYKDIDSLLTGQDTVLSVLKSSLDMDVLDLQGCSLDSILYYVGRGYPVMAVTEENDAVLIVGFDAKNTIIYSPLSGEIFKKGKNDSKAFFDGYGNKYVTYVDYSN